MKITQSWKRNMPTTDGYGITITYVYSSKYMSDIDAIEKKLPKGTIIMDTDKPDRRTKHNPDNENWYNESVSG